MNHGKQIPTTDAPTQQPPELPAEFNQRLAAVLNFSPYLRIQLEANPSWQQNLQDSQPYTPGQLKTTIEAAVSQIATETELLCCVRQIRHRETVRIAWRDLAGLATLNETMRDVSDLADALVNAVLDWWHPQLCMN